MKRKVTIVIETEVTAKQHRGLSYALLRHTDFLADARLHFTYKAPTYGVKVLKATLKSKDFNTGDK